MSITLICGSYFSCDGQKNTDKISNNKEIYTLNEEQNKDNEVNINKDQYNNTAHIIHVLVALCDNKYQGIIPVPKAIGNGQDPSNNLYWGCGYGIRSYFKKSKDWILLNASKEDKIILERLVFKHKTKNYYLIADAYNGMYIKNCIVDFLQSISGNKKEILTVDNKILGINGNAPLVVYIGHNGLMDFKLSNEYKNTDGKSRKAIILGCFSKSYFGEYLKTANAYPLLWTSHLMAPEAYILHDALEAYIENKDDNQIQTKAAKAYAKYQKCSEKAAHRLLVTGW